MIEELQATGRWTFTFVGANIDSISTARNYGIDVKSVGQSRYWNDNRREHFRMLANTGVVGVFRNQNWKYHSTSIEKFFIDECEKLNIDYKRQYPIEKYGHQYDFYIPKYNLLVEMDGVYFHN